MKIFFRVVLLLLSTIAIYSCATPSSSLSLEKMGECQLGDNMSEYVDAWEGSFKVEHNGIFPLGFIVPDREITVIVYKTIIEKSNNSETKTYTMLAFADEKLIFWGYPEEFLKNPDKDIRKIGEVASNIILEQILGNK